MSAGTLDGIRVIELAGIGPGPFGAMILADHGADVIRIDRADPSGNAIDAAIDTERAGPDLLNRGKRSIAVDLKDDRGLALVRELAANADVLIEGFRPGVAERLGLGPDQCTGANPRLVYGRVTGWGGHGPLSGHAGHDLNYLALSGVLSLLGRAGQAPTPPANLLGDFAGGGLLLAFGVLAALVERATSGAGQVVDAAMIDGVSLLATVFANFDLGPRGTNLLDTGAPFYDVYECSDGEYVSIASVEPQFAHQLRVALHLSDPAWEAPLSRGGWPAMRRELEAVFRTRSRDDWVAELGSNPNLCFAPVLSLEESARHPHNAARRLWPTINGVRQPAPAPRFSRSVAGDPGDSPSGGADTTAVLTEHGYGIELINDLIANGVVA